MNSRVQIYPHPDGAAAAGAAYTTEILRNALNEKKKATLAVSGGSTPKLLFDDLARGPLDWSRIHIFFVDERPVPPGDPQSNYTLCETHLLTPAGVPSANVHRIHAEFGPSAATASYVADMRAHFRALPPGLPVFDLILCGVGPDCHTASLFPGTPLIQDRLGIAAVTEVAKLGQSRITLLPGVLLAARHLAVLACGPDKAQALDNLFHSPFNPESYPAQLLLHDRDSDFFLDTAAAARLSEFA